MRIFWLNCVLLLFNIVSVHAIFSLEIIDFCMP